MTGSRNRRAAHDPWRHGGPSRASMPGLSRGREKLNQSGRGAKKKRRAYFRPGVFKLAGVLRRRLALSHKWRVKVTEE